MWLMDVSSCEAAQGPEQMAEGLENRRRKSVTRCGIFGAEHLDNIFLFFFFEFLLFFPPQVLVLPVLVN